MKTCGLCVYIYSRQKIAPSATARSCQIIHEGGGFSHTQKRSVHIASLLDMSIPTLKHIFLLLQDLLHAKPYIHAVARAPSTLYAKPYILLEASMEHSISGLSSM